MSTYQWLLLFHIGFGVIWLGGATMLSLMALRLQLERNWEDLAKFGRDVEWIGLRVFTPVSLITLIFGILLILETGWEFSDRWITIAFSLFIASFLLGAAFLGPQAGKVGRLIEERGSGDSEAQAKLARLLLVARLDLVLLFGIFVVMIWKPGV